MSEENKNLEIDIKNTETEETYTIQVNKIEKDGKNYYEYVNMKEVVHDDGNITIEASIGDTFLREITQEMIDQQMAYEKLTEKEKFSKILSNMLSFDSFVDDVNNSPENDENTKALQYIINNQHIIEDLDVTGFETSYANMFEYIKLQNVDLFDE